MIAISAQTYEQVMRVLRSVNWIPDADSAADQLRIEATESATRDAQFNNETPAFLRAQI